MITISGIIYPGAEFSRRAHKEIGPQRNQLSAWSAVSLQAWFSGEKQDAGALQLL